MCIVRFGLTTLDDGAGKNSHYILDAIQDALCAFESVLSSVSAPYIECKLLGKDLE